MSQIKCPRCGGIDEREQPDPLSRCEFCGALLASRGVGEAPLEARRRLDGAQARARIRRALGRREDTRWHIGPAELVYYPFAADGPSRAPFRPLADLPPLLARSWRASGADLVREQPKGAREGGRPGARVALREEVAPGTTVVMYPFFHLTLESASEESACWCDAVDGQVMLPEELHPHEVISRSGAMDQVRTLASVMGLACGILLPFPFSLFALLGAGAWFWIRTAQC